MRAESFERRPSYSGGERDREPVQNGGDQYTAAAPPSGPRGSFSHAAAPPSSFRQGSNSTATTYPRTMKFGPGGQPLPDAPTGPRAGRDSAPYASSDHPRHPSAAGNPSGPHQALSDLPKIVPGGVKMDSLVDRSRADRLEEEAERLRRVIEEKSARKRKSVREWERLGRESEQAGLRSALAEESVAVLAGEEGGGGF